MTAIVAINREVCISLRHRPLAGGNRLIIRDDATGWVVFETDDLAEGQARFDQLVVDLQHHASPHDRRGAQ